MNDPDAKTKASNFYMREKIEFGVLSQILYGAGLRIFCVIVIIIYMYGALSLKFVSGAVSFEQAVSHIIFSEDKVGCYWHHVWYPTFDPYYVGLILFGFFSCAFSFGDIENSKIVQVVSLWLRYIITVLLMAGCIYHMSYNGIHPGKLINFDT